MKSTRVDFILLDFILLDFILVDCITMSKLYDTFTAKGELAKSWEAYGVSTTYDAESKILELTVPEGWTDLMQPEEKEHRQSNWKIDEPQFNVTYDLILSSIGESGNEHTEKLYVLPSEGDELEFKTGNDFQKIIDVAPGFKIIVEFRALVKLKNGSIETVRLLKGVTQAPETPVPLPSCKTGIFLVLEAGFHFYAYYGEDNTITGMSLVGNVGKLEKSKR